jgi:hypothetical protein
VTHLTSRPGSAFLFFSFFFVPAVASTPAFTQTLADTIGGCLGNPPENTIDANPSNYRTLLTTLGPGDRLLLAAGTYTQGLPIADLNGESGRCIVVEGPASGPRAIIRPPASLCCNTVSITDSSYVALRHLDVDSQGNDGIDGVKAESPSTSTHHVTLEDLSLSGQGGSQQTVGISTKCPSWNWVIRLSTIVGAGTGLYLGNSDGSAEFVNGLIEHNLVRDTIGYNMQIKHQNTRNTGIGEPSSGVTIVRQNVFSKAGSTTSPPDGARPNLLVGHWPLSGAGSSDHYEIYGNFFHQNALEALFQGEGNIALYDNVFLNDFDTASDFAAAAIQPQNDEPQSIEVFHNTVVSFDRGIRVTGVDPAFQQIVRGNAVFAATPLTLAGSVQSADNVTDTYGNADSYLVNPAGTVGAGLDLFPLVGTLTGSAIDTTGLTGFLDWDRDFNGNSFDPIFRGAYSGEGTNPGWPLALEIKPEPAQLGLSIADVAVTEGDAGTTNAVFTVTLSTPAAQQVTVAFATVDGTATAGSDYTAASGTLTFAPSATTQSFTVDVLGDTLDENDEAYTVTLTNPTGGATLTRAQATGGITDDDASPSLAVDDLTLGEGSAGGTAPAIFTVSLSEASGRMVTVTYATAGGTATSGSDFWPRFGALSFAPGTTTRTVAVPVVADRRDEPDETYSLVLSSPLDATLADDTGIGTILDDDAVPALSIRGARRREGRTGTRDMLFPVRLSTFSGRTVLVGYTTSNGTASAGSDYVFTSGTLTFSQGTLQQVIHVPIFGDAVGEANETLFVTLSGAVDATLAVPQATGRILDDDGVR